MSAFRKNVRCGAHGISREWRAHHATGARTAFSFPVASSGILSRPLSVKRATVRTVCSMTHRSVLRPRPPMADAPSRFRRYASYKAHAKIEKQGRRVTWPRSIKISS
eukprot:1191568-Prorocentrum_minimum.AAC.1